MIAETVRSAWPALAAHHPGRGRRGDVPVVTDVGLARDNPALAVFSVVCHGDRPEVDDMFPALLEALRSLGTNQAMSHYNIVFAGLSVPTLARWRAFMTTAVVGT
jgi:hypothetical protein